MGRKGERLRDKEERKRDVIYRTTDLLCGRHCVGPGAIVVMNKPDSYLPSGGF